MAKRTIGVRAHTAISIVIFVSVDSIGNKMTVRL